MNYYSNIYWHFTGSPKGIDWTKIYSPKEILNYAVPKSDDEALHILELILESKSLKASCQERITSELQTQSFCCVTDIPIQNLREHTKYYGNIAIGFNHNKIQEEFNPVFYIPSTKFKTKLDTVTKPNEVNFGLLGSFKYTKDGNIEIVRNPFFNGFLATQVDSSALGSYIYNYFKITNFSDKSDETFYREREWRKLHDFRFEYSDIAAVIVPSIYLTRTGESLSKFGIKNINVVSWELLDKI